MENGNYLASQESSNNSPTLKYFNFFFLSSQILGVLAVIITGAWISKFKGGLAWQSDPSKEFNYHPLFMVIGFIFLNMEAALIYRAFRDMRKPKLKLIHGAINAGALIFSGIGLKAVFDSHNLNKPPFPNLYSLHSWLGIITTIMFGLQLLFGAAMFLIPSSPMNLRKLYLPFHTYFGAAMYVMAVASCLMGITEIAIFSMKTPSYSDKSAEGILINFLGIILIILGTLVPFLLIKENYRRIPKPEEIAIQHLK
ncbi:unnamed protein product [Gordionus sp. m RMFG-2023]|uniref:transmembrane ascorbate-dependent reductase CYB561-like isoform X2 n=1 Tax=Gordionus sp. m RMFG-2023 TaxID=3053472 RepID=UPI0030DFE3A9